MLKLFFCLFLLVTFLLVTAISCIGYTTEQKQRKTDQRLENLEYILETIIQKIEDDHNAKKV